MDIQTTVTCRTIISVNQLSIYGEVAEWCGEVARQISAPASSSIGKPIAHMNEQLDCSLAPEEVTVVMKPSETDVPALGSQLRDHNERRHKVIQTGETGG